jgi:hypothetical protein
MGCLEQPLLPLNGENMRIKELPRAAFNYYKIKEMEREGVVSNRPLL